MRRPERWNSTVFWINVMLVAAVSDVAALQSHGSDTATQNSQGRRPARVWSSHPVLEMDNPANGCEPILLATSNVIFTRTTPRRPGFVYLVQPDRCHPTGYTDRELYMAIYDGEDWTSYLLDTTNGTENPRYDALDSIIDSCAGNRLNLSARFEADGSVDRRRGVVRSGRQFHHVSQRPTRLWMLLPG